MVTDRLINRPVWFDLSTCDLTAAKALYADLFGWTFGDSPAELGFYTMAFAKGLPAAAVAPKMQPGAQTLQCVPRRCTMVRLRETIARIAWLFAHSDIWRL